MLDAGSARAIAINTSTAYWSVADAVLKAPLAARDAGGGATLVLAGDPDRIVADDRELFVIERDPAPGTIYRVDIVSGTKSVVASAQRAPTSLALDAKHVYWTAKGDGRVMCASR